MEKSLVRVEPAELTGETKHKSTVVLKYTIQYPVIVEHADGLSPEPINRFYKGNALKEKQRCEGPLHILAVQQYEESKKFGFPVRVFEVFDAYTLTDNRGAALSLYIDAYEYLGGAHGTTQRGAQTWNLPSNNRTTLEGLYTCPGSVKPYILEAVYPQAIENAGSLFPDYRKLMNDTFNENNFFTTPAGVTVFYQQYDIAPYASGIVEFTVPYGGCLADPSGGAEPPT